MIFQLLTYMGFGGDAKFTNRCVTWMERVALFGMWLLFALCGLFGEGERGAKVQC